MMMVTTTMLIIIMLMVKLMAVVNDDGDDGDDVDGHDDDDDDEDDDDHDFDDDFRDGDEDGDGVVVVKEDREAGHLYSPNKSIAPITRQKRDIQSWKECGHFSPNSGPYFQPPVQQPQTLK